MNQILIDAPVASVILAITLLVSFLAFSNPELKLKLMLHPYSIHRGTRVWSVITSGFIHADLGHLAMNMISFYFFAFTLEATIGSIQFGVLYLAGMVLADVSTILKYKDHYGYYSLGASGAVSAVLFSFILYFPKVGIYLFFIPIPIDAYIFAGLYLIYSIYASRQSSQINHEAHFYGALSGLAITILFNPGVIARCLAQFGTGTG